MLMHTVSASLRTGLVLASAAPSHLLSSLSGRNMYLPVSWSLCSRCCLVASQPELCTVVLTPVCACTGFDSAPLVAALTLAALTMIGVQVSHVAFGCNSCLLYRSDQDTWALLQVRTQQDTRFTAACMRNYAPTYPGKSWPTQTLLLMTWLDRAKTLADSLPMKRYIQSD